MNHVPVQTQHLLSVPFSPRNYLWQPAVTVSLHSCSMQRSGTMGSISGTSIVSLTVLLGEGNKPWWPRGDGLWKDVLKRAAPGKDGAAMPGEWARLGWKRIGKEEKSKLLTTSRTVECFDERVCYVCILCSFCQLQRVLTQMCSDWTLNLENYHSGLCWILFYKFSG